MTAATTAVQLDGAALARLGEMKSAGWAALREHRHADYLAVAAELRDACEDFRRQHLPKALEVFVVCDRTIGQPLSVYRRTPTGRAVLVYAEAEG